MFIVVMFLQFQVTSPILALHSHQSNPSSSLRVRYLRLWVVLLWWRWTPPYLTVALMVPTKLVPLKVSLKMPLNVPIKVPF